MDAGDRLAGFAPEQDASLPYRCTLGTAPPDSEEIFVLHDAGGVLPIAGVGQAGLTARPAVMVQRQETADAAPAAPLSLDEAIIELVLVNLDDGVEAPSRPFDRAVELECRADGACYHGPVLVEISHLAKLPELEGLRVGISLRVLDVEGQTLCRSRSHGVLDRA